MPDQRIPFLVIGYGRGTISTAMGLDPSGELLELVLDAGSPDPSEIGYRSWDDAGICDIHRGANPDLQMAVRWTADDDPDAISVYEQLVRRGWAVCPSDGTRVSVLGALVGDEYMPAES
jgi:hypothetical protein